MRIVTAALVLLAAVPIASAATPLLRSDGSGDPPGTLAPVGEAADQGQWKASPEASRGMYPDWSDISWSPFPLIPADVGNPVLTAADVTDVDARYVADPFLFRDGNVWWMFFEVCDQSVGRGKIGVASSADGLSWTYERIVLDEPWHLAYPFVFMYEGSYYLLPCSSAIEEIRLYRAVTFPWSWEYVGTLMSGRPCVDPTLVYRGSMWWLFVGGVNSSTCRLYYSADLLGPWVDHPLSPIATGPGCSRPAGRFFACDGSRLIRLAQKCDEYYGEAVKAFEIDLLTPIGYHDFEIPESPILGRGDAGWNGSGMHQCDAWWAGTRWIAAVDGFGEIGWCIGIYCSAEDPAGLSPESAIPAMTNGTRLICANPLSVGSSIVAGIGAGAPPGDVDLTIHDIEGRFVGALLHGASSGSRYSATWSSTDAQGRPIPAGTYLLRLRVGDEEVTRRVVVIR